MPKPLKNYVWNADDYAKHSSSQYAWARQLIPKLKLSGNETLLDIGCGNGKITTALAKCLPKGCVVGIDSSQEMINLALHAFPPDAYPNLSFQRMDARALTFQAAFDRRRGKSLCFSSALRKHRARVRLARRRPARW